MTSSLPLFPELSIPDGPNPQYSTGVLASQQIRALVERGSVSSREPLDADQIQPASVDLRLGSKAYRVRASFLPHQSTVEARLEQLAFHEIDLRQPALLEPGSVYVIPLLEDLALPAGFWAKANPKSTTGRLDIFARLLSDHANGFDYVPEGYKGPLYLEVIPRSFSVRVIEGTRLSQLRFWRGRPLPSDTALVALHEDEGVVQSGSASSEKALIEKGLWVRINLLPVDDSGLVGFQAKPNAPVIDLDRVDYYEPLEFWNPVYADQTQYIVLDPNSFYILRSLERLSIPPTVAAEMMGYEARLGEFRVHYAGFFDPGFGYGRGGTPAVLEVRSLGVPYVLEHGQIVARLLFDRLQTTPDLTYGPQIGSSYQFQELALSKHFRSSALRSSVGGARLG